MHSNIPLIRKNMIIENFMNDFIYFNGKKYLSRWIIINAFEYLIAEEDLNSGLFDAQGRYVSEEAKNIDELILFFVDKDALSLDESGLVNYVRKNIEKNQETA